jgi:hypothetical protein
MLVIGSLDGFVGHFGIELPDSERLLVSMPVARQYCDLCLSVPFERYYQEYKPSGSPSCS